MSQDIWASINPLTTSGIMLAGLLDDFKDALMSGFSGSSRPSNLLAGGVWVDTTNQAAPNYYWAFNIYDGSTDTEIFRISILNGFGGTLTADGLFQVQEIAADSVGAILHMVKQRILVNGQVEDGDTVAEIRFTGRTDTSTNPTVAYIRHTATEDMTATDYGGTFTMYSTPEASATITEHLRFIAGIVETVAPHKVNSVQPVSQNVATTATIAQLSATYGVVEMTGVTATDIQGIDSAGNAKVIKIHNRSTAVVTLKHQSSSATAVDRIILPLSTDIAIAAQESVNLFYCTTDTRWKLLATQSKKVRRTVTKFIGTYGTFTAPTGVSQVRIVSYNFPHGKLVGERLIDSYGNMYMWGANTNGQIGVGDVTARSSPVAVLGGITFSPISYFKSNGEIIGNSIGLSTTGQAYAWGVNTNGQLGLGDVTPRSSPVAVLGGIRFATLVYLGTYCYGLSEAGQVYAWGLNQGAQLGVGDSTPRSSPVAVLGGLKFSTITCGVDGDGFGGSIFGITKDGTAYGWGGNASGELGLTDRTGRSSPVAVTGGLVFKKIVSDITLHGPKYTMGLTSTGQLYSWGNNRYGNLGVGDVVHRSSPVAVLGGLTFIDVEADGGTVLAMTSDGTLYSWGINTSGQLGLGDVASRSSPVAVLGGLKFSRIIGGRFGVQSMYAIAVDGTGYAWGSNGSGRLAVGDITDRSSPVAIIGGLKWDWISPFSTVHALTTDGVVYSWGSSSAQGTIGDGTANTTARSSPIAVLGGTGGYNTLPANDKTIDVTPGSSYTIILSQGQSTFGNISIGTNIESITIEYDTI